MFASITAIGLTLASYHFKRNDQNEFNPGIYVEANYVRMGYYRNSHNRNTAFLGVGVPFYRSGTLRASGVLALASGYRSPVIGGLELVVREHFVLNLVPPTSPDQRGVVGFAVRFTTE